MTTLERPKWVQRIAQSLCRRSYPRFQMTLMVTATGLAGFLTSLTLLHLGLTEMWLRYPLSVLISYGVFLLLLKLWIVYQHRSLSHDLLDASDLDPTDYLTSSPSSPSISCSDHGSAVDWSDLFSGLDTDEWIGIIVLLVALLAALAASVFIVVSAPTLLAEVFLDAVVVAGPSSPTIRARPFAPIAARL